MHFRAFVAIAMIAAVADYSRVPSSGAFVERVDATPAGRADVSSTSACDAKLIANLRSREAQRPRRSGAQSIALPFVSRLASGIEYQIPAKTGATLFARNSAGFDGVVTFAAGRGRLDMLANPAGPELVTAGVSLAPPLAKTGEYYLFDSTGFILVRPSQKTFSSFVIADHEFNFENRRNGWPSEFAFIQNGTLEIDTMGAAPRRGSVLRHEPTRIYWILKMGPTLPMFPVTAMGRLGIADAPPGEGGIARWIGPTEALANMARRGAAVDERWVELTSVVPLYPPQRSSIDLTQKQNIRCLRKTDVDLSQLVLPGGFTEASWPGFQNEPDLPRLRAGTAEKWGAVPRSE